MISAWYLIAVLGFGPSIAGAVPPVLSVPLGSCSTPLGESSPERVHNIALAASRIDGTVLPPGERFSFNQTVGQRTPEAGFEYAPILLYGERETQLGGGVCQLSGTLYNATLLSGLQVLERHRHSSPVVYLPMGQDATVSWGVKDLVFENSSDQSILIRAAIEDENVVVGIFGSRPLDYEIHLETDVWDIPSPFEEVESSPGLEATLYRVKSRDGQILERQYLHRDLYPPSIILEQDEE